MAIPVAANVGGMGTPIGTPPNAIALKYLNDPEGLNLNIGFGEWMSFMLPYTIIVLFIAWFILLRLFPFKQKNIELQIEGEAAGYHPKYAPTDFFQIAFGDDSRYTENGYRNHSYYIRVYSRHLVKHPKYDCDSKSDINHNGTPVFFGFTFNL